MIKNLVSMGRLVARVPGERNLTESELKRSRLPAPESESDSKI
jgi:hypothetical protein